MTMNGDSREEQLELLREIAKWTRESALPTVRDRVIRLLDTEQKKRVYQAIAEGTLSYRALETETGVNRATIRQWITEWEGQRIVQPDAPQPHALFTLHELGIPSAEKKAVRPRKASSRE
jgi:transposase-like protein